MSEKIEPLSVMSTLVSHDESGITLEFKETSNDRIVGNLRASISYLKSSISDSFVFPMVEYMETDSNDHSWIFECTLYGKFDSPTKNFSNMLPGLILSIYANYNKDVFKKNNRIELWNHEKDENRKINIKHKFVGRKFKINAPTIRVSK